MCGPLPHKYYPSWVKTVNYCVMCGPLPHKYTPSGLKQSIIDVYETCQSLLSEYLCQSLLSKFLNPSPCLNISDEADIIQGTRFAVSVDLVCSGDLIFDSLCKGEKLLDIGLYTMAVWPCPHFDFWLNGCMRSHPNGTREMAGKFKVTFFISIYEFNIFFFL